MPLCIFFAIDFFGLLSLLVSFFHMHVGTHSRCKACWMGHPTKNSLMSLQLEVILERFQSGLTSLQARFLKDS